MENAGRNLAHVARARFLNGDACTHVGCACPSCVKCAPKLMVSRPEVAGKDAPWISTDMMVEVDRAMVDVYRIKMDGGYPNVAAKACPSCVWCSPKLMVRHPKERPMDYEGHDVRGGTHYGRRLPHRAASCCCAPCVRSLCAAPGLTSHPMVTYLAREIRT